MRLSALLSAIPEEFQPRLIASRDGDNDPALRSIVYDSRSVTQGALFVALRGSIVDGHRYLKQAVALGAVALLSEEIPQNIDTVPVICVSDTRRALAYLANAFYGTPSKELTLIGVTGTNGKTSTTYLVESILKSAGKKTGVIGTIEIRYADQRQRTLNTTPESLDLQRTLRSMRDHKVQAVAMEVSSHGTQTGRVDGCVFQVAALTNLTQDHLDFHGTMQEYCASKRLLFSKHLAKAGTAVINIDDPSADTFLAAAQKAGAKIVRVSRDAKSSAEIRLESANVELHRTQARVVTPKGSLEIELPLIGDFNLENMLIAVGIGTALDIAPTAIVQGIHECPQVPGRVEHVSLEGVSAPTILVDYAHTPDALDKLLRTVRPLTAGKLITIFGCGGDRDRSKRPLMAKAVAQSSDFAILTNDNPRTEDPNQIFADIVPGMEGMQQVTTELFSKHNKEYVLLPDRRSAIQFAIASAKPQDTVLIAGKGHEDYQIIGHERLPFDDRREASRALRLRSTK